MCFFIKTKKKYEKCEFIIDSKHRIVWKNLKGT